MQINKGELHNFCNMKIKTLRKKGQYTPCTSTSGYTFIDNDSKILGVAHTDTVQHCRKFKSSADRIYSPRLDDRLGVYTLLDLLPSMGIKLDVLLCEDEEIGQSTAQYFTTEKEYNWIVEFDRTGFDVVLYQYRSTDLIDLLENHGFIIGWGSFSDISYLDTLGVGGFNVGVGYYDYHSVKAYMVIKEYLNQISRFVSFYNKHKDTKVNYVPVTYNYRWSKFYDKYDYDFDDYQYTSERYLPKVLNKVAKNAHVRESAKCLGCGLYIYEGDSHYDYFIENGICYWCDQWFTATEKEEYNLRKKRLT